ncbi:hypothetical protein D3C72_2199220 [compost metagenome]
MDFILAAVTLPTPKNFSTASASIKASTFDGPIKVNPSGLFISEAILATNLLIETPAEAVSCNSVLIASLIRVAISMAEPMSCLSLVTSR